MLRITRDLLEVIDAVDLREDRIIIGGEPVAIPSCRHADEATVSAVATALYRLLYCRPAQRINGYWPDVRAARIFVEALSQANSGRGSWQPGWIVKSVEGDGSLAVQRPGDDLVVWAQKHQFRPDDNGEIVIGRIGRLRLGKELREMLPGYYTILGEADQHDGGNGSPQRIVRYYWHLTVDVSRLWVRELTRLFNAARLAFHAKVLSDPGAYIRADAGVLYIDRANLAQAMALLPDLHQAVSSALRESTPMFTKRLAVGLAVAEDPGDGRSFGEHRCRLVAEGLVRAFAAGRSDVQELAESVAARFAEEQIDIMQPWLNPGSRERYVWPGSVSRRRHAGTS